MNKLLYFFIDKTKSMDHIIECIITNLNDFIKNNNDKNFLINVTFFSENDLLEEYCINSKIKKNYIQTIGNTEFYDSLSTCLDKIKYECDVFDSIIFIIITDGLDNKSKKNINDINFKLNFIRNKQNIEFIYFGANHNSYEIGHFLEIPIQNINNFFPIEKDINTIFKLKIPKYLS
jgi:hypothetical protein